MIGNVDCRTTAKAMTPLRDSIPVAQCGAHTNRRRITAGIRVIAGALLVLLGSSSVFSQVNISVNWNQKQGQTTKKSFGINCNFYYEPSVIEDARYIAGLKYIGAQFLRFHDWGMITDYSGNGWTKTDGSWNAPVIVRSMNVYKNNFPNAIKLMNIPRWPLPMCANSSLVPDSWGSLVPTDPTLKESMYDACADWCAQLVKICNIDNKFAIKYWEFPNEQEDLYSWSNSTQYAKLLDIYSRAAKKMKAMDPTILVGGLGFMTSDGQDDFLTTCASKTNPKIVDFISEHHYPCGGGTGYNTVYDGVKQTDQVLYGAANNFLEPISGGLVQRAAPYNIETFLDEFNLIWGGDDDPPLYGYPNAVFYALAYTNAALQGVSGLNDWDDLDQQMGAMNNWPFANNDPEGMYQLRARAHTEHMLNTYFVGDIAQYTVSDETKIHAFAVKTATHNAVMIINISASAQNVKVNFNGWTPASNSFRVFQVRPSGTSIWASFDSTQTASLSSLTSSYSVPANSVTTVFVGAPSTGMVTDGKSAKHAISATMSVRDRILTASATMSDVSLLSLDGKTIFSHRFEGASRNVSLPRVAPGLYLISGHLTNGTSIEAKYCEHAGSVSSALR